MKEMVGRGGVGIQLQAHFVQAGRSVASSFRFVTAFADSIVFTYLAVLVCQANGYTVHPHPPVPEISVKAAGTQHSSN